MLAVAQFWLGRLCSLSINSCPTTFTCLPTAFGRFSKVQIAFSYWKRSCGVISTMMLFCCRALAPEPELGGLAFLPRIVSGCGLTRSYGGGRSRRSCTFSQPLRYRRIKTDSDVIIDVAELRVSRRTGKFAVTALGTRVLKVVQVTNHAIELAFPELLQLVLEIDLVVLSESSGDLSVQGLIVRELGEIFRRTRCGFRGNQLIFPKVQIGVVLRRRAAASRKSAMAILEIRDIISARGSDNS